MKVRLIAQTKPEGCNITEFIAYVARVSSKLDKEKRTTNYSTLLKYLRKNKHWSPFEHAYLTFEITTSLAIATQLLRHRSFTFQQLSKRYNNESPAYEPIEIRKQAITNRQSSTEVIENNPFQTRIDTLLKDIDSLYADIINANVASECARFILPQCTQTELIVTGNIRSWIHFLDLRLDDHAQKECRLLAQEIEAIITKEFPEIFDTIN